MTTLPPAPLKSPMLDKQGMVTSPWLQFFRLLYNRVGGPIGSDLDAISDSAPTSASPAFVQGLLLALAQTLETAPARRPEKAPEHDVRPASRVVTCAACASAAAATSAIRAQLADMTRRVEALEVSP